MLPPLCRDRGAAGQCVNMSIRSVKSLEAPPSPQGGAHPSLRMPAALPDAFVKHLTVELPASPPGSFEGFASLVSPMFDLVRLDPKTPFQARVDTTLLPDLYLSRTRASGTRYIRDEKVIARSGTDAIVVLVYLSGPFTLEIDGRSQSVLPGEIVFLDLRQPMTIHAEQVDNLSLVVTRQRLEAHSPSVPDLHGFLLKSGALHDLLLSHLQACAAVAPRLPTADADALSDVTVRLVAASLNSMSRRLAASARHADPAMLGDLKRYVEEHLEEPDLSPSGLTQAFGLSRASLYRFFEPLGGVSAYILERRLHRAFAQLTAKEGEAPPLQAIASQLGFSHTSAFSRAFKRQFGVSPQTVRRHQHVPPDAAARPWKVPRAAQPLVEGAEKVRRDRR